MAPIPIDEFLRGNRSLSSVQINKDKANRLINELEARRNDPKTEDEEKKLYKKAIRLLNKFNMKMTERNFQEKYTALMGLGITWIAGLSHHDLLKLTPPFHEFMDGPTKLEGTWNGLYQDFERSNIQSTLDWHDETFEFKLARIAKSNFINYSVEVNNKTGVVNRLFTGTGYLISPYNLTILCKCETNQDAFSASITDYVQVKYQNNLIIDVLYGTWNGHCKFSSNPRIFKMMLYKFGSNNRGAPIPNAKSFAPNAKRLAEKSPIILAKD